MLHLDYAQICYWLAKRRMKAQDLADGERSTAAVYNIMHAAKSGDPVRPETAGWLAGRLDVELDEIIQKEGSAA